MPAHSKWVDDTNTTYVEATDAEDQYPAGGGGSGDLGPIQAEVDEAMRDFAEFDEKIPT